MKKQQMALWAAVLAVSLAGGAATLAADNVVVSPAETYQQSVQPLVEQLMDKEAELDRLYAGGVRDDGRVAQLNAEIGELRTQLYSARLSMDEQYGDDTVYMETGRHHYPRASYARSSYGHRGRGYGHGYDGGYGYGHRRGHGHGRW
ncbi:MAG: hypothetical protein LIP23_04765 [Planctomycetes bacterium]|nr:hypothetical protein [Planctomycetota bacterium]